MILSFISIVNGVVFQTVSGVIGLISDVAVLILTWYTLYISALSRKLVFNFPIISSNTFYGEKVSLTVTNKTLHSIPLKNVFILKRCKGKFYKIEVSDYKTPITIRGMESFAIEMEPFTYIEGWPIVDDEGFQMYDDILMDAVIGYKSDGKVRWIKPYKNAPIMEARIAYKNNRYETLTVDRYYVGEKCISALVDCKIKLMMYDVNGNKSIETFLGISTYNGGNELHIDGNIEGYNAFQNAGHTPKKISKTLQKLFDIDEKRILVEMISHPWKNIKN